MERSKLELPGSDREQVPARSEKRRRLRVHRAANGNVAGRSVTSPLGDFRPDRHVAKPVIEPSGVGEPPAHGRSDLRGVLTVIAILAFTIIVPLVVKKQKP